MEKLLEIIFPPKCAFCSEVGQVICKKHLDECNLIFSTECIICQRSNILGCTHIKCQDKYAMDSCIFLYKYEGYVRNIIKNSKYGIKEFSLLKKLTRHAIRTAKQNGLELNNNLIILPIPTDPNRLKKRGFNQAQLIAKEIAKGFKLKIDENILYRKRQALPQYSYNKKQRFENVNNVFSVKDKHKIQGRNILLVDDISTSGATFIEATQTIKKALNNKVNVHALALSKMSLNKFDESNKYAI